MKPGTFKPGDPRINRQGRPKKGKTLTDILEKWGKKTVPLPDGTKRSRKEILAQQLWTLAIKGDATLIKYIYDRIDGRPPETVRHSGEDGGPILVDFTGVREKLLKAIDDTDNGTVED